MALTHGCVWGRCLGDKAIVGSLHSGTVRSLKPSPARGWSQGSNYPAIYGRKRFPGQPPNAGALHRAGAGF